MLFDSSNDVLERETPLVRSFCLAGKKAPIIAGGQDGMGWKR